MKPSLILSIFILIPNLIKTQLMIYTSASSPVRKSKDKIISCCFSCFVSDFFYYQYGICRMYSKENPQYFRLPVSGLYP